MRDCRRTQRGMSPSPGGLSTKQIFHSWSLATYVILSSAIFRKSTNAVHGISRLNRSYFPALKRRPAREVWMEIAAAVLFGSIALWIAEELNGNKL